MGIDINVKLLMHDLFSLFFYEKVLAANIVPDISKKGYNVF